MDYTELNKQVGELLEFKKQAEEKFKNYDNKFEYVTDMRITLKDIEKTIESMQEKQEELSINMGNKLNETATAVKELGDKLDALKDKPKNNLWNTILEGKKTIITIGIGLGAAFFWEHIIAFLKQLFK